ncbi:hypothetical protein CCANI_07405 [Corynebacterium canis]|nr:hypothetical protein CCANI_07405 [Corynebacterium canis]
MPRDDPTSIIEEMSRLMKLAIIDKTTGREYWTAHQCAKFLGIARDTFTSYVSRGQAPAAAARFENLRVWDAEGLKEWNEHRPGSPVPGAGK